MSPSPAEISTNAPQVTQSKRWPPVSSRSGRLGFCRGTRKHNTSTAAGTRTLASAVRSSGIGFSSSPLSVESTTYPRSAVSSSTSAPERIPLRRPLARLLGRLGLDRVPQKFQGLRVDYLPRRHRRWALTENEDNNVLPVIEAWVTREFICDCQEPGQDD